MITEIDKDITEVTKGVICHQVNCFGVMGKGVALQIRNKWPVVYSNYRKLCEQRKDDRWNLLAMAQIVHAQKGLVVANLFAQYDYGRASRYTEYGSLKRCLLDVRFQMNSTTSGLDLFPDLYFPYKLGCVNGGGDWDVVRSIIAETFANTANEVYICKL